LLRTANTGGTIESARSVEFTLAGQTFRVAPSSVPKKLRGTRPGVIRVHAAKIGGRLYPVKQVVTIVTGIPAVDFNSHQARQIIRRLGFPVLATE